MFEVVVIGGGPSGVTAALRARELGATVALIESEHMGGVSTNDGCVPTRVLARAARLVREAEQFADYGLKGEPPAVNFIRLLNHTEQIVRTVHEKKQLRAQLEAADVHVFDGVGDARFLDRNTLALGNGSSVQGEKFILCVGGHARMIPLPGSEHALTHSDVWTMKKLPESVAVVGGAATGCQLASVFAAFGSRVTLLEVAPRILAAEDEAVSEGVAEAFERRGIEIVTGIGGVEKVERENGHLSLLYAKNDETHTLDAETIMFAVGWPGNVEGLNLEAAGVETRRGGYVQVDDSLRTSAPHILAAGDITGRMMLVQSATNEGNLVTGTLSYRTVASPTPSMPAWASPKIGFAAKVSTTPRRSCLTRNWIAASSMGTQRACASFSWTARRGASWEHTSWGSRPSRWFRSWRRRCGPGCLWNSWRM